MSDKYELSGIHETKRNGIIDGIETTQTIDNDTWSSFPRWKPVEAGRIMHYYVVEQTVCDSPSRYYVAVWDGEQFRAEYDRRVVLLPRRWRRVLI